MNTPRIRPVMEHDASALLAIYAPYVERTAITFEYEPPSLVEFTGRIQNIAGTFPYLVCEDGSGVCGYAYAGKHMARKAYQWGVETTVYIDGNHHSRGMGSALYGALLTLLRGLGYFSAYALITMPNEKSVKLHEAHAFTPIGVLRKTGYKLGAWHDVLYMEAFLDALPRNPVAPRRVDMAAPNIAAILEKFSGLIRP